jgi:hypothetical protein
MYGIRLIIRAQIIQYFACLHTCVTIPNPAPVNFALSLSVSMHETFKEPLFIILWLNNFMKSCHVSFHLDHINLMVTLCESMPMFLEYNWSCIHQSKENTLKKSCEGSMNHMHHFQFTLCIHLVAFEITEQIKFCACTSNFLPCLWSPEHVWNPDFLCILIIHESNSVHALPIFYSVCGLPNMCEARIFCAFWLFMNQILCMHFQFSTVSVVSWTCVKPGFSVHFDYSWLSSPSLAWVSGTVL